MAIAQIVGQYRAGQLSPVQVVEGLLADITNDTAGINAFCWIDPDSAVKQAQAAHERYRCGRPLGPLDGVPVSIKDLVGVRGWPTRRGSLATGDDPVAVNDAPAVELIRRAGGIIFGKTSTTEFGWTIDSQNPHSGLTRNPRAPAHSAGGSSSGAAAQIAAGWGELALGSDAGGSVRIPASWCGVVGFKPTFGALPLAPQSAFAEFAHLGLLTPSVADCASAFAAMAGSHRQDPSSLFSRVKPTLPGKCLRLGWADCIDPDDKVDPEIAAAFRAQVEQLAEDGYAIQKVDLSHQHIANEMWQIWVSRIYESFIDWPAEKRHLLEGRLRSVYDYGADQRAIDLTRSRAALRAFATRIADVFQDIDILLTPASSRVAPRIDAGQSNPSAEACNWFADNSFAFPFNVAQMPAISLPLSQNSQGLPFGIQLVGCRYDDDQVLRFAAEMESRIKAAL